jgi:hypothetical protein
MVVAVRSDEHEDDRSSRDVYKVARSRRRRLGPMSLGAGPFAGVATQAVDLYTEIATFCDVAALHGHRLSDQEIAAHMLRSGESFRTSPRHTQSCAVRVLTRPPTCRWTASDPVHASTFPTFGQESCDSSEQLIELSELQLSSIDADDQPSRLVGVSRSPRRDNGRPPN